MVHFYLRAHSSAYMQFCPTIPVTLRSVCVRVRHMRRPGVRAIAWRLKRAALGARMGHFHSPRPVFGSPSGHKASVIVRRRPYRVHLRGFVGGVRYHRFRRVELRRRFVATVAAECPVMTLPPDRRGNRSMPPYNVIQGISGGRGTPCTRRTVVPGGSRSPTSGSTASSRWLLWVIAPIRLI